MQDRDILTNTMRATIAQATGMRKPQLRIGESPCEAFCADSGATSNLAPVSLFGRTRRRLLDGGVMRKTDVKFYTADKGGAPLIPLGVGDLTVVIKDKSGRPWVIKLVDVYIFDDKDCAQAFLSPVGLVKAWQRQEGNDSPLMCTGSAERSQITLEDSNGEHGALPLTVSERTYYAHFQGVEALLDYSDGGKNDGCSIHGDVAGAGIEFDRLQPGWRRTHRGCPFERSVRHVVRRSRRKTPTSTHSDVKLDEHTVHAWR